MVNMSLRASFALLAILLMLCGCTIELRSPIKISRPKDEEQPPPPRRVATAPRTTQTTPGKAKREPATIPTRAPEESPITEQGLTEVPETRSEAVERMSPSAPQTGGSSAENIVIISGEYLAKTRYTVLGKVTVKDVSQNGFTQKEAKEALKVEAFRQYGGKAKGITNVSYQGESSFFGSARYYEASGDVVTWEERASSSPQAERATQPQEYEKPVIPKKRPPATEAAEVAPLEAKPAGRKTVTSESAVVPEPSSTEPPVPEESTGTASPANILMLTEVDLVDYNFYTLGKVTVQSKSKDGFTADQANSALKVEAFKEYGGKARGIINVTYEKKKGLMNIRSDKFRAASADVVTWKERKAAPRREVPAVETPRVRESAIGATPSEERAYETPAPPAAEPTAATPQVGTPKKILVLSPEELVNIPFTLLGRIQAADDSGRGYDKKRAVNALKVEAYKAYGSQARGITNIDFKRKPGILNLEKFELVYADVVTWKAEDLALEAPATQTAATSAPAKREASSLTTIEKPREMPVPAAEEAEEAPEAATPPEYSTENTDPERIMVLKEDELITPNYKKLGTVTIKTPTRFGLREWEADSALKKEALKQFGGKVRGIINVQYKQAAGLHSGDKEIMVTGASGEAITW